MLKKFRQSGFSLLEVMMAVVVLMMGMVFVASMFPVGLHNSRINVERTINSIEANNAAVMAELIIENNKAKDNAAVTQLIANGGAFVRGDIDRSYFNEFTYASPGVGTSVNQIHFIPRPNVLADSGRVFIDDTEFELDSFGILYNMTSYADSVYGTLARPFSLLASQHDPLFNPASITSTTDLSQYCVNYTFSLGFLRDSSLNFISPMSGDIGKICCPVVDENHPDVLKLIPSGVDISIYADRINHLYPAIYQVALEQKYNWAAAYKEGQKPYDLNIFILRQTGSNVRYAMQNPKWQQLADQDNPYDVYLASGSGLLNVSLTTGEDMWLDRSNDCLFPVPWLVYLDEPISSFNVSYTGSYASSSIKNSFRVNSVTAQLLRPGAVIIDADPEFVSSTYSNVLYNNSGKLFRIKDVSAELMANGTLTGNYIVELETEIDGDGDRNSLFRFWVFPPAIDRDTNEFATEQPVIDVIKKTYRY